MAKKRYYRRTAEEKKQQVDELLQTLEKGVKSFKYSPEVYKAILEMQALMPRYSFRNIMLAKAQLPNARFLASFKRWKELGRHVVKGEKALRILAPRFIKIKNEETGEEEDKLIGFIDVPVFDFSQTVGEPLPIERVNLTLDGESEEAAKIFEWAKTLALEDNCPVELSDEVGSLTCGFYNITHHKIVIKKSMSLNQRAKTLVHELVHSRVHRDIRGTTAKEREIVAEGTAFVVCTYFGLNTKDYSFGYIKGWSKDGGVSLMKYGEMIQKTAHSLITDFERISDTTKTLDKGEPEDVESISA